MTAHDDALVRVLVDLAEVMDATNAAVRRHVEKRRDLALIPVPELRTLGDILRHPGSTIAAIAASTGLPPSDVGPAARSHGRRGLITPEVTGPNMGTSEFRATAAAVELRDTARDRSAQILRYALAGISPASLAELEAATSGIAALSAALGWHDIHRSYRGGG